MVLDKYLAFLDYLLCSITNMSGKDKKIVRQLIIALLLVWLMYSLKDNLWSLITLLT